VRHFISLKVPTSRGGEINCPCCPSRTFGSPDKLSFPVDLPVDKWKIHDLRMSKEHHLFQKSQLILIHVDTNIYFSPN